MESISLSSMSVIITILAIVLALLGIVKLLDLFYEETSKNRNKAREAMRSLFIKTHSEGRELDIELIKHIKQSIERQYSVELSIGFLLQDFLTFINSDDLSKEIKIDLVSVNGKVKNLIEIEKQEKPYENLPDEEKRLMRGLKDSIEHNDKVSTNFHLDELSSVMTLRNKTYQKEHKLNKWSLPLAVVGLVLTIVFGLAGILGGIDENKITDNIKNTIKQSLPLDNLKQNSKP